MKKSPKQLLESPEALQARLEEMERKLDRLRGLYESYFMGIERAAPSSPRRDMNRLVLETQQIPISNSSQRFRFQALVQRWVTFTAYWNRTLREIESGTYRRDLARAQRHLSARGGAITEEEALALGIPANRVKAFVGRQQRKAAATSAAVPSAASWALPGVTEGEVEETYRRYVQAHKKAQDPRPMLTLEKMKERLGKQLPKILAEKGCSRVKLDVAVEEGRVRLRAWPDVADTSKRA